jgi:uncharacterized membrane protein
MDRLIDFLKTTALGGFFVLLPILLLYLMLGEAFELVVALATPIADLFPPGTFDKVSFPVLLALLLILSVSFALGLAARSELGGRLGRWVERRTLDRVPLYRTVKGFAAGFAEIGGGEGFKPALLVSANGQRQIAYRVEEHGDGQVTVMLPRAPTPLSGSVKIVRREQVEMLDARLADVTRVLSHWGVGARDMLHQARPRVDDHPSRETR